MIGVCSKRVLRDARDAVAVIIWMGAWFVADVWSRVVILKDHVSRDIDEDDSDGVFDSVGGESDLD